MSCDGSNHSNCVEIVRTPANSLAWHVKCYELVRALLTDDRVGLAHPFPELAARYHKSPMLGPLALTPNDERDQHSVTRKIVQSFAAARNSLRLQPMIDRIVSEEIAKLKKSSPPVDFHASVSIPFPVAVVSAILGVYSDRDFLTDLIWRADDATDWDTAKGAIDTLHGYMLDQLNQRRRAPRNDLLNTLVHLDELYADENGEPLQNIASTVLIAGSIAPSEMVDHGLLMLLTHSEARERLLGGHHDTQLLDEMLRFGVFEPKAALGEAAGLFRYASVDFELADAMILEGDLLILNNHEANFDEQAFADPFTFQPSRRHSQHLSFGFGRRRCPGANVAYMELGGLFRSLFEAFPGLALAATVEQVLADAGQNGGRIARLPVTW